MNKISILAAEVNNPQIKPLRERLGNQLCKCYGIKNRRDKNYSKDEKLDLSIIPAVLFKVFKLLARFNLAKGYYTYFFKMKSLDYIFANKISNDQSSVVYLNPLFVRSAKKAKKRGKKVVVVAGNSEPQRENSRIEMEYDIFNIKHKYIYGDPSYKNTIMKSYSIADSIITISNVSKQTYIEAGYDIKKFHLIPLTGTDFPSQPFDMIKGKERAFISTAFHNFIKGTHRLLLAWKQANIKDIPLIIVGRLCEDMEEFVDKNGPFDNVQFMGFRGDLVDFYKRYDAVGVLMSISEGAGRTTPELMSFGFPMIVSPDATCDIVKDGYNGFIVNSTDEDRLVERLLYFATDWNRVHSLRENVLNSIAHRTVKDFSIEVADYLMEL